MADGPPTPPNHFTCHSAISHHVQPATICHARYQRVWRAPWPPTHAAGPTESVNPQVRRHVYRHVYRHAYRCALVHVPHTAEILHREGSKKKACRQFYTRGARRAMPIWSRDKPCRYSDNDEKKKHIRLRARIAGSSPNLRLPRHFSYRLPRHFSYNLPRHLGYDQRSSHNARAMHVCLLARAHKCIVCARPRSSACARVQMCAMHLAVFFCSSLA